MNLTVVGTHPPALKNSFSEVKAVTNPLILTAGVGVFGVKSARGVIVPGVGVKSGVDVSVLCPASVGVSVNVGVGIVGVEDGTSVEVMVLVATGVAASTGSRNICSTVMEQDESRSPQKRNNIDLFM